MVQKTAVGTLIKAKTTNRCLFLMRNGKSFGGQFALVGGKVRSKENGLSALAREIDEELGVIPSIIKIVPMSDFVSEDNKFRYFSMLIVVEDEFVPRLNDESSGYAWVSLRNLPRPMHPRVRKLFEQEAVVQSIERFK